MVDQVVELIATHIGHLPHLINPFRYLTMLVLLTAGWELATYVALPPKTKASMIRTLGALIIIGYAIIDVYGSLGTPLTWRTPILFVGATLVAVGVHIQIRGHFREKKK